MTRTSTWCALVLVGAALAWARPAAAQEDYLFRAAVLGGLGGAADSDTQNDLDQRALQLSLAMVTNDRTLVGVRVGRLEFDADQSLDGLTGAELEYANVAGEYRFDQGFYDFGLYLGLGIYRLSGDTEGGDVSDNALGLGLGVTGDFDVTRHLAFVLEATAHYAFLDDRPNLYVTALAGVAARF